MYNHIGFWSPFIIIGIVLLVFSVLGVLGLLSHFSIITLAVIVVEFIVGFLLAYGLLSKYLFSKGLASAKIQIWILDIYMK